MALTVIGEVKKVAFGSSKGNNGKDKTWELVNIGGLSFWGDSFDKIKTLPEEGQRITATVQNKPYKKGDEWVDRLTILDWQPVSA